VLVGRGRAPQNAQLLRADEASDFGCRKQVAQALPLFQPCCLDLSHAEIHPHSGNATFSDKQSVDFSAGDTHVSLKASPSFFFEPALNTRFCLSSYRCTQCTLSRFDSSQCAGHAEKDDVKEQPLLQQRSNFGSFEDFFLSALTQKLRSVIQAVQINLQPVWHLFFWCQFTCGQPVDKCLKKAQEVARRSL
jgi:hypothetical protein